MNEKQKRPAAVWGTQIILGLLNLMFLFMWLFGLSVVISRNESFGAVIWTSLWGLFINLIFLVPGIGLILRKNWGRWSATILLGFVTAGIAISQILRVIFDIQNLPSSPAKSGYILGSFIGLFIFCGIPAYLVYRMVTADTVYEFFNPPADPDTVHLPPPPPTFSAAD